MSESGPGLGGLRAGLLAGAFVCAVAWPLATYTLTLALFGLVHVLAELRYVDRRFGRGLGRSLGMGLGISLAGLVALRSASHAGWLAASSALVLELGLGIALVALVVPTLWRARPRSVVVAVGVASALMLGIVVSPVHALLAIAVLHNVTPLGFVAERTQRGQRARAIVPALLVFVVVPLVIASGGPWALLSGVGLGAPEFALAGFEGGLGDHMRAFIPEDWIGSSAALHAFSACAFLQCAHYLYVIDVLPRAQSGEARGVLPWPRRFGWLLAAAALVSLVAFSAADFFEARRWYGVAAAVHAWVELPILLLALAPQSLREQ